MRPVSVLVLAGVSSFAQQAAPPRAGGRTPTAPPPINWCFNDKWEELHREGMLRELQQRIHDMREGPDGYLYLVTAENDGALMRMAPAPAGSK